MAVLTLPLEGLRDAPYPVPGKRHEEAKHDKNVWSPR